MGIILGRGKPLLQLLQSFPGSLACCTSLASLSSLILPFKWLLRAGMCLSVLCCVCVSVRVSTTVAHCTSHESTQVPCISAIMCVCAWCSGDDDDNKIIENVYNMYNEYIISRLADDNLNTLYVSYSDIVHTSFYWIFSLACIEWFWLPANIQTYICGVLSVSTMSICGSIKHIIVYIWFAHFVYHLN